MTDHDDQKRKVFVEQALVHADQLYRYGIHLTKNSADADDLVQETYLKAYRFWHRYEQGTNIRAWLFRILKNSHINICRAGTKQKSTLEYSDTIQPLSDGNGDGNTRNQVEPLFANLLDDEVSGAVADLPEDFRTVVILSDIEGLTYEEIARFLDCPVGTVRSRLHRGRRILKSALHNYAKERAYVPSARSCAQGI